MIGHALRNYFAAQRTRRHELDDRYVTGGDHALALAQKHMDATGQHIAAIYIAAIRETWAKEGRCWK
jgi:hypothetical protein